MYVILALIPCSMFVAELQFGFNLCEVYLKSIHKIYTKRLNQEYHSEYNSNRLYLFVSLLEKGAITSIQGSVSSHCCSWLTKFPDSGAWRTQFLLSILIIGLVWVNIVNLVQNTSVYIKQRLWSYLLYFMSTGDTTLGHFTVVHQNTRYSPMVGESK